MSPFLFPILRGCWERKLKVLCGDNKDDVSWFLYLERENKNRNLWRKANARNVRLYYPYRQYTNLNGDLYLYSA